jgi:hypothetical protein
VKEGEEGEEEDYERRQEALDKKEAEAAHETISRCASSIQRVCESFSKVNPSLSRNVRPPFPLAPFVLLLTLEGAHVLASLSLTFTKIAHVVHAQ